MVRILIPLAQGCEELEAVTLIDLFRRAGFEVVTAGLDDRPVTASRGTRLLPDVTLDSVLGEDFDLIALPGGQPGADNLQHDTRLAELLGRHAGKGRYTAAICAAPKVLASAGLLEGRHATAFPGVLEAMNLPDTTLTTDVVTRDGHILTSRGPGTAMDFALSLIELLAGADKRAEVEGPLQRPV
ncbi:MAG: DJ-1/PfpI family protein [Gammaproteobacteria bacterium]|jgi:4-methyl-5(b-hydroxyethyl)-thiazole monophosphate biosynthesis